LLRADAERCPTDGAAAETVETLPGGSRLGPYRIERVLGEGGMGYVYEATHEALKRRTAIKMLRPELAKIEQIVTRFLNEAKAVNLIDHQNVVNVYDYGDGVDGSVYFVMEFLEGETLDDLMRKRQPMQVPLLLHVFGQIGKALAAAHARRIVHRDLKPGNVFVVAREDNPYFIKLLDFGIAQLRGEGAVQGLTVAGVVMGTPQYMSPEQISGGTVDVRTDVWALGVMLYRAATGQAPFRGEEFAELADKIFNHSPVPANELVPMPASLARLIASCLERDINARCQTVTDFLAGLEQVKQEVGQGDTALLEAVKKDAGAIAEVPPARPAGVPAAGGEQSLGTVSWYRSLVAAVARAGRRTAAPGVDPRGAVALGAAPAQGPRTQGAPAPVARRSRLGLFIALGALAGGLASAGVVLLGRGEKAPRVTEQKPIDEQKPPGPRLPEEPKLPAPDDRAGWRAYAERDLREAIASGTLQQQGFAVDALDMARVRAGTKLLYLALKKQPDVQVKAARALAALALPEAAPKVREALNGAGERLKVDLAAALHVLGDKDGRTMLQRALDDQSTRLAAAVALAEGGDAAGRAALLEALELPAGREQWRRAAGGLLTLGDARARKLLEGELSQADAARAIRAAELLARAGDSKAREQLAAGVADAELARRGDAAVALARLGDKRALGWVAAGLKSVDPAERKLALGVCGALAADAGQHAPAIAERAATDEDLSVRMTAEAVLLGM
jgi:tRNA A-37 threonylcarbamoyl transferase component Bud32/HEAT repeat protein